MAGHLKARIVHQATQPIVRAAGPAVARFAKHFLQFLGFCAVGLLMIILPVDKVFVVLLGTVVTAFGGLVVLEQVRLTYEQQDPSVYEAVEPFEQRRPMELPDG
jgi:hypothetical protein